MSKPRNTKAKPVHPLIGRTIVAVELLGKESLEQLGWDGDWVVLIRFDDGSELVPSADEEQNRGGAFRFDSAVTGHGGIVTPDGVVG